jgi:glycosyltransferase involved in cell wall biosynthesis
MKKIGIFFENPFKMGGTETWILNICKIYAKKYDITIYYRDGEYKACNVPDGSYDRLASLVKVVGVNPGEEVKVDIGLWAFDYFHLDDTIAKKKYLFIHPGDGHGNHPRTPDGYKEFTEVIAVSNYTRKKMKKWAGIDCRVVYDPVPPQKLHLVSLSRSAKDKGWKRAEELAKALNRRKIDYQWDVFTDFPILKNKSFTVQKPTIHAIEKVKESDFLVQLSDHESFGYSMVEGMQYSKLIVTNIEILPEMGINKKNAVVVPLKNANYDKVVDDILSRMYTPPQTDYAVLFGKPGRKPRVIRVKNPTEYDAYIGKDRFVPGFKTMTVDWSPEVDQLIEKRVLREVKPL